ncbi:DUF262 domain-containing protein [Demequina sp. SYSU T00192]|uniref:DUF262 domain-containing protein n=1 Tax=Demequina litoralis TaxID=3051660 RepID=A0ABT8GAU2_9MICO|nr:DUF262 domain-containing protein [Demequina sp. SYSU T00192]MDN4475804.1 DUF262 domain-containing protein [Demequina sp. SYSU T00192]
MEKYTVHQQAVGTILNWVATGQVAIPEIQRPFVWNSTKVRDLIDSLYNGYPVGYLITWQTHDVKLKDGTQSGNKQILIDGQQRVTALTAALAGQKIVTKEYVRKRIQIAFNPQTERFETFTPVMRNDPAWILDIAELMNPVMAYELPQRYFAANPDADRDAVIGALTKLSGIQNKQVGIINLDAALDIETVTEIFIRINSKGVVLNSADFAMSKIAAYGDYGANLRKYIDYFCHLAVAPHFHEAIRENDAEFAATEQFRRISWLKDDAADLYDPDYRDVIRVAGLHEFGRGRIDALVSYLSGRDFETRTFKEELALESFERLERALDEYTNQYNFTQFLMIIQSAGFDTSALITSRNALNFAYALFLRLRRDKDLPFGEVQRIVRRWFVMSMLTGRASGSVDTQFELDIRRVRELGAARYLATVEESELSDGFWRVGLPQALETSSTRSPYFRTFLASQVFSKARGFLSQNITVSQMLDGQGDIHHLFPKAYLDRSGIRDRADKNQVANYVLAETAINIAISDKAPADYMGLIADQVSTGERRIGEIVSRDAVDRSLRESAVPDSIWHATASDYRDFLEERRVLMASAMRDYYESL